ncbi:MAG: prepilin-type N-terminal cleavage/methylation domain-containing protein [Acidobacteria bacterium]|nr:prepilin-type N-terminal cleavage/methylation domain-containing protein [Acidobacteriota bacterium]
MTSLARAAGFTILELLIVVAITMVVAAIALPMTGSSIGGFRLQGDARSVASAVQLTKLRAAADFTKARLYTDLSTNAFHVEVWSKDDDDWARVGGTTYLQSVTESFSFAPVASPPPSTQATIGQAAMCKEADGDDIGNTACIVFNSRGIPVTDVAGSTGGPTNAHALYLSDGTAVFGVTVSATSVIQLWRTNPNSEPSWVLQ